MCVVLFYTRYVRCTLCLLIVVVHACICINIWILAVLVQVGLWQFLILVAMVIICYFLANKRIIQSSTSFPYTQTWKWVAFHFWKQLMGLVPFFFLDIVRQISIRFIGFFNVAKRVTSFMHDVIFAWYPIWQTLRPSDVKPWQKNASWSFKFY